MCDPSIMGIASMATNMADAFGQMGAQKKQEDAYNEWKKTQDLNRTQENATQEKLRTEAEAARTRGVNALSGPSQQAQQTTEQGRLTNYLLGTSDLTRDFAGGGATDTMAGGAGSDTMTSVADKYLLAGQGDVAKNDPQFMSDLAGKLSSAAKAAKDRIGNLAAISSYGGSFGGLDNFTTENLQRSGMTIDEINNFRNGQMKVYGAKQAVDPLHIVYQSGIKL
jgi:hypothetical protein